MGPAEDKGPVHEGRGRHARHQIPPAVAAVAEAVGRAHHDDQHHDQTEQGQRTKAERRAHIPIDIVRLPRRVIALPSAGGAARVIALVPAVYVVKKGPGGAVVLPGVVAVIEVVLQPALDGGGGQGVLNAGARQGPHLVLTHGVHQHEAVGAVHVADAAPVFRHRHGIVGRVHAVHEVHRHHHDLAAGGAEQGLVLLNDVLLGILGEDLGVVGHIAGLGGLHHRGGGGIQPCRSGQGAQQGAPEYLLHGSPPIQRAPPGPRR